MTVRKTHPYRVVVADDSVPFRSALIRFLAMLPDIQVIGEAANGWEALQVVEATAPDLLILDIQMPELNGLEVLHQLQAREMRVQVLVLSAHGNDYRDQVLASGAAAFVPKGDIPRLHQTLSDLVNVTPLT